MFVIKYSLRDTDQICNFRNNLIGAVFICDLVLFGCGIVDNVSIRNCTIGGGNALLFGQHSNIERVHICSFR